MRALKTAILFVTALAVTTVTMPQASSQTPPPAQQPPPAEQAPPPPPPPAEEQHNSHPVAKGAAAGAAFGAASNATGKGSTTVVHTGSANRSSNAKPHAKPIKPGSPEGKASQAQESSILPAMEKPAEVHPLFLDHIALALTLHVASAYGGIKPNIGLHRGGLAA
jgi:hypothetical protein